MASTCTRKYFEATLASGPVSCFVTSRDIFANFCLPETKILNNSFPALLERFVQRQLVWGSEEPTFPNAHSTSCNVVYGPMVLLPNEIDLVRAGDNHIDQAQLIRLTRAVAKTKIDAMWWQDLGASTEMRKKENDNSWQWAKRLGELRNNRWHESLAVETHDGNIQGAILYWLNTRSFAENDKGAVYIEALASAPRNRPWLVPSPLYRGVGEGLLLRATLHSYVVGLEGRVNLLSFRDQRTASFYKNRGFEIVGEEEGLDQMELSPAKAFQWLKDEGYDL